jgi:hypothetical protein
MCLIFPVLVDLYTHTLPPFHQTLLYRMITFIGECYPYIKINFIGIDTVDKQLRGGQATRTRRMQQNQSSCYILITTV